MSRSEQVSSSKWPIRVGIFATVAMFGGFGVWAAKAEIDGAVLAPGRIVVDHNRQAVQHPQGGVVEDILVKEGDSVEEGDVLVRLDPTIPRSELLVVEGQLFEIMARRGRLEAERDENETITFDPQLLDAAATRPAIQNLVDGQIRLFDARRESLEKSVVQFENQKLQLKNQIEGIDAQMEALERQLTLITSETDAQQILLDKGLAQNSRVLALQRESARLSGSRGELVARRAQAMERISELEIMRLQLFSQRREEAITVLRDLQYSELELAENRNSLITILDRLDIRAPVSGVVYDLRLMGNRSVVRPADPLLFIVPNDRPLLIEARVDPLNVNDVYASQEVIVRFRAFDMRETPDLVAEVSNVSPDALEDPQTGLSYYRAEVELPESELAKLSSDQVLIPGMQVDTFIRTGKHTPLTYLTSPLTRYFSTAMRDEG